MNTNMLSHPPSLGNPLWLRWEEQQPCKLEWTLSLKVHKHKTASSAFLEDLIPKVMRSLDVSLLLSCQPSQFCWSQMGMSGTFWERQLCHLMHGRKEDTQLPSSHSSGEEKVSITWLVYFVASVRAVAWLCISQRTWKPCPFLKSHIS